MSIPLIILGAGASFDYIREDLIRDPFIRSFKPPLTDEIFRTSSLKKIVEKYPALNDLVSSAESAMQHGQSLEDYLTEIKSKNKERQSQIVALQFYLQNLFQEISEKYVQPGNNYNSLIATIKDAGTGEACIVTFNYDSLFEKALGFPEKIDINDYIQNPIKLIKAHGSCDWVRVLRDEWGDIKREHGSSYKFLIKNPSHIKNQFRDKNIEIYIRNNYEEIYEHRQFDVRTIFYHPQIVVPLAEKEDTFVCPDWHTNIAKDVIAKTNRILIIGWKGGDKSFIRLIEENIKNPIELTIVTGSEDSARDTYRKFNHIANISPKIFPSTFSNFMGSDMCKQFFSY